MMQRGSERHREVKRWIAAQGVAEAILAGESVTLVAATQAEAQEVYAQAGRMIEGLARRRFDYPRFAAVLTELTRRRVGLPVEWGHHAWAWDREVCTVCGVTSQRLLAATADAD